MGTCTHLSLNKDAPAPRPIQSAGYVSCPDLGWIASSVCPDLIYDRHRSFATGTVFLAVTPPTCQHSASDRRLFLQVDYTLQDVGRSRAHWRASPPPRPMDVLVPKDPFGFRSAAKRLSSPPCLRRS